MQAEVIRTQTAVIKCLMVVIVVLLGATTCLYVQVMEMVMPRPTCASFTRRTDALKALPTNPQLDADHDKNPCENLPI